MIEDPKVGITIKPTLGDLLKRTNTSQRPDRPAFFLGNDIMSTGKTFDSFINDLISEHGSLIITPRKKNGTGILKIDGLGAIEVSKSKQQPEVDNSQPEVNQGQNNNIMEMNGATNSFGMNGAQMLDLMRKGDRADDWRDKADEYKDKLRRIEKKLENTETTLKGEIDSLIKEKRDLQTDLSAIDKQHELDLKIQETNHAKGLNSPVIAELVKTATPLVAKFAIGSGGAPAVAEAIPGMAGKNISKSKTALLNTIVKADINDDVLGLLEIVGSMMSKEPFIEELGELIGKHN